jgi:hypothetical protein
MSNPFSTHLAGLIEADGRTLARIAREAVPPLTYSTTYGWATGTRLPADGLQLAAMVEALGLTRGEGATLRRKYQIAMDARAKARVANGWARSDKSADGLGRALIHGVTPHHACLSRFDGRWIVTGRTGTKMADDLDSVLGSMPAPSAADLEWVRS